MAIDKRAVNAEKEALIAQALETPEGRVALAQAMVEPILTLSASLYGYTGTFPVIDTTITMQVLFGILGLGAFRSYDKAHAPSPKGKE